MRIKNSLVINEEFVKFFSELININMPVKRCLEVSASIDDLSKHCSILIRARKAIANRYCKKGEDGNPLVEKDNLVFESEDLKKKFSEEIEEIDNEEFDLQISEAIKISSDIIMTPLKMRLLKGIIEISD